MKKIFTFLLLNLMILIPINVSAQNNRIVDNANKLSENEEYILTSKLDALSDEYDIDIVVYLSIDNSYGDDIVSEGCEFFDNNGYGYGEDHRGLLLIVNYEESMFDVITTGIDVREKYDDYIEDCYDAIQDSLGTNPYEAIEIFASWIDTRFIKESDSNDYYSNDIIDDYYYNKDETNHKKDNTSRDLLVALIGSLVISTVVGLILKGQLKTEGKKHGAINYIDKNSFNLTRSGDVFLYRTTSRRRIKIDDTNNHRNSGGGGFSISHTSSSGISHGSGGGRSF